MGRKIAGLMSGTSVDGIDTALADIDGYGEKTTVSVIASLHLPFPAQVREKIFRSLSVDSSDVATLCSLNVELGCLYAEAVKKVCEKAGMPLEELDLIGSHGQTVQHIPADQNGHVRSTLQIGDPSVIAYETGTPVISQFRMMDMAAGGEGAPLVPYVDYLLYRQPDKTVALQNIGGIGNVTVIPAGALLDDVAASDTGPGNMLIDAACEKLFGLPFDRNGEIAAKGKVIEPLAEQLLAMSFFQQRPPKSTGRELFGMQLLEQILLEWKQHLPEDLMATLTAFTAETIRHHLETFIFPNHHIDTFIVSGGGSYNRTLVQMIKEKLPGCEVVTLEDMAQSSEAKEAVCFAVLANESWHGQYGNVLGATGASERVILGQFTPDPHGKKRLQHFK